MSSLAARSHISSHWLFIAEPSECQMRSEYSLDTLELLENCGASGSGGERVDTICDVGMCGLFQFPWKVEAVCPGPSLWKAAQGVPSWTRSHEQHTRTGLTAPLPAGGKDEPI